MWTHFFESSSLPESELLLSLDEDLTLCTGDITGTSPASARIWLGDASEAPNQDCSLYSCVSWSRRSSSKEKFDI